MEDFISGPIGSHLVRKAREQSQAALDQLKTVDPEDAKTIRALQNTVMVADSIVGWLGDVIHEGQAALEALKEDIDGN